jgi:hypothetical protein
MVPASVKPYRVIARFNGRTDALTGAGPPTRYLSTLWMGAMDSGADCPLMPRLVGGSRWLESRGFPTGPGLRRGTGVAWGARARSGFGRFAAAAVGIGPACAEWAAPDLYPAQAAIQGLRRATADSLWDPGLPPSREHDGV